METILVTGAAGFIGSKTTKDLLRDGFNVTGVTKALWGGGS